ncbi:phage tail tip fiber protein [Klebsiella pneumoniae]
MEILNGKLSAQWGVKVGTSSGGKHYVSGFSWDGWQWPVTVSGAG